ncbi:unnamed protein product [Mycena citricolor]|uniref:Glutathione hydrolase n=1 Tax=Mycena citricolor TaxID=2018698 RepID=A0AAD2GUE9_9AGAR|nr:unnamed protein product [Mycena citricolor]
MMFDRRVLLAVLNLLAAADAVTNYQAQGKHGAVVSEVAECSDIGLSMLKKGGTAADAMIATSLCVGTIAAYHSGIGGGGFMIIRSQKKDGPGYEMIDFRETMPAAGNETMYLANATSQLYGGLSAGVPGELRGWEALHKAHGKLPWKSLFEPAIKLALDGYNVNADLAAAVNPTSYPFLVSDPLWAETYAPHGTPLVENQRARRKRYAKTLEKIANHGADAFYTGAIAERTAAAAQQSGGIMTTADLANYTVINRVPANITYRGKYRIFSTVAPSSGSIVLSILKTFEGYNGSAQLTDPAINDTTHELIQATRFGYAVRQNFGDPAFTANVTTIEQESLTEQAAELFRSKIDNITHPINYYGLTEFTSLEEHGTSHLAVADQYGNAISLTTTVNFFWGSRVMTEDGIILNDEMDDFSSPGSVNGFGFPASPINFVRPFKRPQSSISSSIVEDLDSREFVMATGSAGGSRIITATLQHLYHHLDQGYDALQCTHASRWHDQLTGLTYFELPYPNLGLPGFSNATIANLVARGYNATYEDSTGSTAHVIVKKDGVFQAANDPRKSAGGPAAY